MDTLVIISAKITPNTMLAMMKMRLNCGLMTKHITMLDNRLNGARTDVRIICWYAFCRLVTSVVMRVTRPDVLYLSMSLNANRWMFLYMASRRLQAKPDEA